MQTHAARPQGWESALEHLRGAAAAVAAVMPAAPQADPTSPGKPKAVGALAPGQLAGPNVSTPVTILSLETGELEVSLVAQAPSGASCSCNTTLACDPCSSLCEGLHWVWSTDGTGGTLCNMQL